MKLRVADTELFIDYEAAAAMTAALVLDRENRVACCLLAALLHELGHVLVMRLCGVRVQRVRLRLFDVLIEAEDASSAVRDALITLGGPAANLLLAAAFCPFSLKLGLPHLALGIFNLMPVMSLDGGHLLYLCLTRRFSVRTAELALRASTFIFLLPLMTAGLYLLFQSGYNYSLLVISLYLIVILFLKK